MAAIGASLLTQAEGMEETGGSKSESGGTLFVGAAMVVKWTTKALAGGVMKMMKVAEPALVVEDYLSVRVPQKDVDIVCDQWGRSWTRQEEWGLERQKPTSTRLVDGVKVEIKQKKA